MNEIRVEIPKIGKRKKRFLTLLPLKDFVIPGHGGRVEIAVDCVDETLKNATAFGIVYDAAGVEVERVPMAVRRTYWWQRIFE